MSQIKWTNAAGGDFATGTNWMGGVVPGPGDDAVFALGGHYVVTSAANETVNSLQMVKGPTLSITAGTFVALNGSGSGADNGLIQLGDNTAFEFGGTLAGAGTLQVNGTYYGSNLLINSATATLSGGGTIALGDFSGNRFYAAANGEQLINASDTITGAGALGNGNMAISNGAAGVIDATAVNNQLVLNVGTYGMSNAGLIEATGTAGLIIDGSSVITQSGTGSIQAINSNVYLENASIVGGAISSTGTGVIQAVYGDFGELNGVKISAGTVQVNDNATLYLDNTITNAGTVFQYGTYYGTYLDINSAAVTLTGGGSLTLSDYTGNRIQASVAGDKLVNLNNTISGSGQLGNNSTLAIDNRALGVINSNGAQGLTIDTTATVTNEGLIKDTGVGGLGINATTVTNTGTIAAFGAGSHVDIYGGSSIIGGFFATSGGGVIDVPYGSNGTLDGSTHANPITITAGSTVQLDDNSSLELNGSIVNSGTIFQEGTYYGSYLVANTPTVTLSGGGTVLMNDMSAVSRIEAAGTTGYKLVNINNTIIGSGQIGNGTSLAIDNQLGGTINSDGTAGVGGLTISTLSGLTNEGLIEDTGTGTLFISATTVTNTGTIAANGAGSVVNIGNAADIIGGTLVTTGGGVIQSALSSDTLDGLTAGAITLAANSTLQNLDNIYLYLDGTITNKGTIIQAGTYYGAYMIVNSATVTLNGGGTLRMSEVSGNQIYTNTAGYKLVNVNNTITGSGQIGAATGLVIDNQIAGVINSSGTTGLTLNTTAGISNEGLIEDTGVGSLFITATTVTNTGTIAANGAGSVLNLGNATDIIGGTLATSGGGVIQDVTGGVTLDGLTAGAITLTTGSTFQTLDNQYLGVEGTITNHGTISQFGTYYGAYMVVNSATVTLNGGGTLLLSDLSGNEIYTNTAGYEFVNVDNKIVGSGQIGVGTGLAIDNQAAGIINSNGIHGLTISTTAGLTNEGLIEDTNTGSLAISSTTVTNAGTIAAYGAGSQLSLVSATIDGGVLATTGGGVIVGYNSSVLDGSTAAGAVTITTGSLMEFLDNQSFSLNGTINNHGTIFQDGTYYGARLYINSPTVTLNGGGTLLLSDQSDNYIYNSVAGDKLVNTNNIIAGAGQFGENAGLVLDNQAAGLIDATGANNLDINLGAAFTNEGTAEGSGSGGLYIQNTTLTNTGTIAALSDSTVTIDSTNMVTNFSGGTLTNGTWESISAGGTNTSTLSIAAGPIFTDAATLVLSGVGSNIVAAGTAVETSITTITSKGVLEILNGRSATATNVVTNSGTILLSGSLSETSITNNPTGLISGVSGTSTLTVAGVLTNKGILQADGGKLTFANGKLANTGTVQALAGSTLTVGKLVTDTNISGGTLTGGTWAAIGNGATLALDSGPVTVDAAVVTLSGTGSVFDTGTAGASLESTLATVATTGALNILGGRSFASTVAGGLADAGSVVLGGGTFSASVLDITGTFAGTGAITGPVTDNGTLTTGGPATGTLTVTGAISGTGVLASTAGDTLTASGGYAVGSVSVAAGSTLNGAGSSTGAIAIAGTLAINGGTLSGGSISITGVAGLLTGNGTVVQNVANAGTINASGGTLALTGGETGGALAVAAGAALVADAAIAATSLTIAAGGSFVGFGSVSGTATDNGTLTASLGTLTIGTLTGTGNATVTGSGKLTSSNAVALGGSLTIASGGSFVGFGSVGGTVTDNGSLTASGGALSVGTLMGNGSATVSGGASLTSSNAVALGGSLTIAASGSFSGYGSVTGTVTDNGSLTATGGALSLGGLSGTGSAVVAANASLSVASALTLGSLTIDATGAFTGFGTVTGAVNDNGSLTASGGVLSAGTLSGSGSATVASGATLTSPNALAFGGSLTIAAGGSFVGFGSASGTVSDNGTLTASGGNLSIAALSGSGKAVIAAGATLTLNNPLKLTGGLAFATGGTDVLSLAGPSGNTSAISGFSNGDTIDIRNTVVTADTYKAGTLTLKSGTTKLGTLKFTGSHTAANFTLSSDGHGGTDIIYAAGAAVAINPMADLQSAATTLNVAASTAPTATTMGYASEPQSVSAGWADLNAPHAGDLLVAQLFHLS